MGEFNLIDEPWIPVLTVSGARRWIRPAGVSSPDDRPVRVSTGRPDFDGALTQFLIGLLQTCATPKDDKAWRTWMRDPPAEPVLGEVFGPFREAFFLTGAGPLSFQDQALAELDLEPNEIGALLIEAPGGKTVRDNADHFIHRGQSGGMSLPTAAMALLTLQTNAPSGGVGHRVSLRGGGPLTTIVVGQDLWSTVWANTLVEQDLAGLPGDITKTGLPDVFPWMGPTRTSEKGQGVFPQEAHPAQHFWGTPRRILLSPSSIDEPVVDALGVRSREVVETYVTKNYGNNYEGAWCHPLTPYTAMKNGEPPNPKKAQPTGITYRDWPLLTQQTDSSRPAKVVDVYYRDNRWEYLPDDRLAVFGYDMDNMKARCWYSATTPIVATGLDQTGRQRLAEAGRALIEASESVRKTLIGQVKASLFDPNDSRRMDFTPVSTAFWAATERPFFSALSGIVREAGDEASSREGWLEALFTTSGNVFQRYSQASADFSSVDAKRLAVAWNNLRKFTSPRGKKLRALVGLPPIEKKEHS